MKLYIEYIASKKLLASAVSSILGATENPYRSSVAQITVNPLLGTGSEAYDQATSLLMQATRLLLERAAAAGDIRGDLQPRDLLRALAGFTVTYGDDVEGWEASALRLVDVLMDGLASRMIGP